MSILNSLTSMVLLASGDIQPPEGVPLDLTISGIVAGAVKMAYVLVGIIFFALIIFAGFTYLTSEGNPEKTKQAQSILIYAFLGAAIALAAGAITGIFETVFGVKFQ